MTLQLPGGLLVHVRVIMLGRSLHQTPQYLAHKLCEKLSASYSVLCVTEECDEAELRQAYLTLAKKYHPDSGSQTAHPHKFTQVEQAYQTIKVSIYMCNIFLGKPKHVYERTHIN